MDGIGTIRIKMFDDVLKKLSKVRYVSQMKKSIISVGAVESKGLKGTLENGNLKVTKGSMVVMKGIKNRNLYYLKSSTVTGVLAIVVDSDEDVTKLWHMRLGHAGEKSIEALAKQYLFKGTNTCKLKFCEHCVLCKKIKVKFDTAIHRTRGILDYVQMFGIP